MCVRERETETEIDRDRQTDGADGKRWFLCKGDVKVKVVPKLLKNERK